MSDYDQTARAVIELEPYPLLTYLANCAGESLTFQQWFKDRTIPRRESLERIADQNAIMNDAREPNQLWLLVLECQTIPSIEKLGDLHEQSAIFLNRSRHGPDRLGRFRVLPAIMHLTGVTPYVESDGRTPLGFGLFTKPVVWDLSQDSAAGWLERVVAGEQSWSFLFWLPLMADGGNETIARRWREVVKALAPQKHWTALVETVLVFSELARNWRVWELVLEDFNVGESAIINRWRAEAAERATLRTKRAYLLEALDIKFPGQVPDEIRRLIEEQGTLSVLDTWFKAAIRAITFEAFLEALSQ